MLKYSLVAAVIAAIVSIAYAIFFKSLDEKTAMVSSVVAAAALAWWFVKIEKRAPSNSERTLLVLVYWVLMIGAYVVPPYLMGVAPSHAGLMMLVIITLPFPLFMDILLREKMLARYLPDTGK